MQKQLSYFFEFFSEPYRTALQQPVYRSKRYRKFNEKHHFTVIPLSSYHGLLLVAHLGRMADWPIWATNSSPWESQFGRLRVQGGHCLFNIPWTTKSRPLDSLREKNNGPLVGYYATKYGLLIVFHGNLKGGLPYVFVLFYCFIL